MTLTVVHRRKVHMLSALASSTVQEVKEMLAERMDVPTTKMRLIFMFEEMQNDRTLESYGVPARAQLILRLKPTRAKVQEKLKATAKAKGKAKGKPRAARIRGSRSSMRWWSSDEGDEMDATGGAF